MSLRRLRPALIAAVFTIILAGVAAPARAQSEIWIHIVGIKSYEVDDAAGKDEPYFKFNGVKQSWTTDGRPQNWVGNDFDYGHYEDVDIWYLVNGDGRTSGTLELWEQDDWPSKDDHIANQPIYASQVGTGMTSRDMGIIAGSNGTYWWTVRYTVWYEVVYA